MMYLWIKPKNKFCKKMERKALGKNISSEYGVKLAI